MAKTVRLQDVFSFFIQYTQDGIQVFCVLR